MINQAPTNVDVGVGFIRPVFGLCRNHRGFDLRTADGDSVPVVVTFDWQTPYDPNFGDQIKYDLYISNSIGFPLESIIIHRNLAISRYTDSSLIDTYGVGTYYWKVKAKDSQGGERWSTQTWSFYLFFMRGDVNTDAGITLSDVIYLANYVLKGGCAPIPLKSADVNCDGKYDLVDVIKLA